MADTWLSNVKHTYELGSQHGPSYDENYRSFSDVINGFLRLGWRIINTYVEDKESDSTTKECKCLMGWIGDGHPKYPRGYGG